MPRKRKRIVFCECFDCRDRPDIVLSKEQLDAATAAARQEPPPKALLLYVTGTIVTVDGSTNLDSCTLPHCNLLVREGNLGLLAVRDSSAACPGPALPPAVSELAQLLGVYQEVIGDAALSAVDGQPDLPNLAARFKGMQAAFASTSSLAQQLAWRLGCAVVDRLCLGGEAGRASEAEAAAAAAPHFVPAADGVAARHSLGLPDAASFAAAVSAELGATEGASGRDLLLLHVDLDDLLVDGRAQAGGPEAGATEARAEAEVEARWDAGCEALEWLDSLVKGLLALPEIRERTLLVLMLSPAGQQVPVVEGQGRELLQPGGARLDPSAGVVTPRSFEQLGRGGGAAAAAAALSGALSVLDLPEFPLISRPVQSFEVLGLERVETNKKAPVLVARRLPGVVRRDRAERLGYKEVLTTGGTGAILVDRLLPEVAYKIARAPKYGA